MKDIRCYKLDGHKAVLCDSLSEWAEWVRNSNDNCRVAYDVVGDVRIYTMFNGIDASGGIDEKPELFETAIFGGEFNQYVTRCSTWEDALDCHEAALKLVRSEHA